MTSPQIDFYISTAAALEQRLVLACRLADKAFRAGHRVYVHCANAEQTQQLDNLLWSFQTSSFVPHSVVSENSSDEPVRIGCGQSIWNNQDVLINLDRQVPESFAQFARVLEIVVQNEDILDNTREHWRHYKQLGHNPQRRELEKS